MLGLLKRTNIEKLLSMGAVCMRKSDIWHVSIIPGTSEVQAGGSSTQRLSQLHNKLQTLSQKDKNKAKERNSVREPV